MTDGIVSRRLRCAECGRKPRKNENPDEEWRADSDGVGELHVFCRECWEREFGVLVVDGPLVEGP